MKAKKNRLFALIVCVIVALTLGVLSACNPSKPAKALDHIELDTSSVKTEFTAGDMLTYSGLTVKAYYDDGTNAVVTNCTVVANNLEDGKLTVNSDTVTVSYTEESVTKTATYAITVVAGTVTPSPDCSNPDCNCDNCDGTDCDCGKEEPTANVVSIKITKQPTKTAYYVGDTYSTEGLEIEVTYDDDTKDTVTSGFTAPASTSTAGEKTVSVIYKGKTDTFTITVYDKLTGLKIEGKNAYSIGDTYEGVTVKALYNNNTTGGVELDEEDYNLDISPALSDGKFATAGSYTVAVTYSEEKIDNIEKSENFVITVADPDAIANGGEDAGSIGEWKYWVANGERNWANTEAEEYCTVIATEVKFIHEDNDGVNIHATFSAINNLAYGFQLFYNDITNYNLGSKYVLTLTIESETNCTVVINGYTYNLTANESKDVEVEFTYSYNGNYDGMSLFDMQVVVADGESYDLTLTNIQWAEPDPDMTWELTKASLVEEDGKVYFVYSGTYANYTEEKLQALLDNELLWDIVHPVGDWPYANQQEGFATIFSMDNGAWKYKTEITVGSLDGFYTLGIYYVNNSNIDRYTSIWNIGDFVEFETETATYKYECVSGGATYWNNIAFMISDVTPIEGIPDEYNLEFSTQGSYVTNNQLLGRWVYYHNIEESNPADKKANGSYDHGTLTFNFTENKGNWWCTQLFYTNIELVTGNSYSVQLTLTLSANGTITVNGHVYELEANTPKTVEFNITQSATNATLEVQFGVYGEGAGTIDIEAGTLTISNVTFGEPKDEPNPGPGGDESSGTIDELYNLYFAGDANGTFYIWFRTTNISAEDIVKVELFVNGESLVAAKIAINQETGTYQLKFENIYSLKGSADGTRYVITFKFNDKVYSVINNNIEGASQTNGNVSFELAKEGDQVILTVTDSTSGGGEEPDPGPGGEGKSINHAANLGEAQGNVNAWNYFLEDSAVTVNKCEIIGDDFSATNKIIIDYSYSGANWTAFNLVYAMTAGKPAGYEVVFTFKSNVAGKLTVSGPTEQIFDIVVGENTIVKNFEGAMLWLRFGGVGGAPIVGSFEIIGIQIREITKTQLDKPSFTYDISSNVITINDEANAGKVKEYKLNFYLGDELKGSVTVVNGEEVKAVGIEPGTYKVKLVAVGDGVRYTDSVESDEEAEIIISTLNTKEDLTKINNDGEDLNNNKDQWNIWAQEGHLDLSEASYDNATGEIVISYQWKGDDINSRVWFGIRLCYRQSAPPKNYIKFTINVQSAGVYMINNQKYTLTEGDNELYIACLGTDVFIVFGEIDVNPGRDSQTVTIKNIEFTNDAPPAE